MKLTKFAITTVTAVTVILFTTPVLRADDGADNIVWGTIIDNIVWGTGVVLAFFGF